jgi:GT2 family glycosyltransferase
MSPALYPKQSLGQALPPASATPAAPPHPLTLSVVIPAYNQLAAVIRCLRSVVQTGGALGAQGRLQILVQDDASPDVNLTEVLGPPAEVVRNERNLGFAGNCNAGATRAAGDVLLFLNQDTRAREGWFAPLLAAFDDPAVGIVGPKLVYAERAPGQAEDSIQSCGGLFGGNKGPYHRYLGYAADDWRVNERGPVAWVTGAALAIRRELFARVGGFDVGYLRGYFEDVDLCMKVRQAGYQIWYEPESCFEHSVGSTGGIPAHIFKANSLRFHRLWDEHIVPDSPISYVDY